MFNDSVICLLDSSNASFVFLSASVSSSFALFKDSFVLLSSSDSSFFALFNASVSFLFESFSAAALLLAFVLTLLSSEPNFDVFESTAVFILLILLSESVLFVAITVLTVFISVDVEV